SRDDGRRRLVAVDGDVWTELGIVAVCVRQVNANSSSATSAVETLLNVAPDAASIAVMRLLARSEDAVIRPFVEQVSREPRLRDPETNTYGGLYLWAEQETYERYIKGEVFNAIKPDQNLENVES